MHKRRPLHDAQQIFLLCLAGYVVVLLNQHFNIPLRILPFALIVVGIGAQYLRPIQLQGCSVQVGICPFWPDLIAVILFVLILTEATVASKKDAWELAFTLIGPISLAILSGFCLTPGRALSLLSKSCVAAILFLAFTDVLHYVRDLLTIGHTPRDYSHRWFGDGYVFFLPWLLLARDSARTSRRRWFLQGAIAAIFLLLAGVGSRSAWICVAGELVIMSVLLRRSHYLLDMLLLVMMLVLGTLIFGEVTRNTFGRGMEDNQRIRGLWGPGLDLVHQDIWFGHGFGRESWDAAYYASLPNHPEWTIRMPLGGPHNIFIQVAFAGGLIALVGFMGMVATIFRSLWRSFRVGSEETRTVATGVLCAFTAFYMMRGLVEDPRWEPFGLIVMLSILLRRQTLQATAPVSKINV